MIDQFLAAALLGSGLLFHGMIFVAAAGALGLTNGYVHASGVTQDPGTYDFARRFIQAVMRICAFKMAAVL